MRESIFVADLGTEGLASVPMAAGPSKHAPGGDDSTVRVPSDDPDVRAGRMEVEVARESIRAGLFPRIGQPKMLGRYVLVRRIGDGGMGLILQAHDPQLDRELAIKIVRPHATHEDSGEHARLLAEARTAARLSHPNVVTIYDVGLHEGRVFVAMELVRGPSLRRWMQQERTTHECLQVMVQAGRGLAAAHAAGLVHRDFKPGNVLVGDDGRVRVVDFGLARPNAMGPEEAGTAPEGGSILHTATGVVAGTPAYMAPEQWIGGSTDPRTDQFSFCLCLYEALFGTRPFVAESIAEMRETVLSGPLCFPAAADELPPGLRAALERGLAHRKEERFESMNALLDALVAYLPDRVEAAEKPAAHCVPTAPSSRADDYLAGLPRGLDSHPDCLVDGGLVKLALLRAPVEHALVASFDELHRTGRGRWIPEAHGRAIMAAIADAHFDDLDAYARFVRELIRARMASGFIGFLLPKATSARAPEAAPRVWRALHRGTMLETHDPGPGATTVALWHPPGLIDALGRIELEQTVHEAMGRAGAHLVETQILDVTSECVRVRARWG